jgi:hypothetical protein
MAGAMSSDQLTSDGAYFRGLHNGRRKGQQEDRRSLEPLRSAPREGLDRPSAHEWNLGSAAWDGKG